MPKIKFETDDYSSHFHWRNLSLSGYLQITFKSPKKQRGRFSKNPWPNLIDWSDLREGLRAGDGGVLLPSVGDAQGLLGFLLNGLGIVQQGGLVKLLYICAYSNMLFILATFIHTLHVSYTTYCSEGGNEAWSSWKMILLEGVDLFLQGLSKRTLQEILCVAFKASNRRVIVYVTHTRTLKPHTHTRVLIKIKEIKTNNNYYIILRINK